MEPPNSKTTGDNVVEDSTAMTISIVNPLSGEATCVKGLRPDDNFASLLARVEDSLGISRWRLRLFFNGNVLSGDDPRSTLQAHGVTDGAEIGVIIKQPDRIACIGGWDKVSQLRSVEALDLDTGKWEPMPSMKICRAGHGAATLKGRIFVVGGFDGSAPLASGAVLDMSAGTWEDLPNMSVRRTCPGVLAAKERIYVWGGKDTNSLNTGEFLEPADGNNLVAWAALPPMRMRRELFSLALLHDNMYAIGGYGGNEGVHPSRYLHEVEVIDTSASLDSTTTPFLEVSPMTICRAELGSAVVDGKLYAIGGTDNVVTYDSVEVFDPAQNHWAICSTMSASRASLGAVAVAGKIYVFGGITTKRTILSSGEAFDPVLGTWDEVAGMCETRALHCAVMI